MKSVRTVKRARLLCILAGLMALLMLFTVSLTSAYAAKVESGNLDKNGMFDIPYTNVSDVYDEARALHEKIVDEGTTLLKNDGSLPLAAENTKVTLFNGTAEYATALKGVGYDVNEFSRSVQVGNGSAVGSPNESSVAGVLSGQLAQQKTGNAGVSLTRPESNAGVTLPGTYDIGDNDDAAVVRILRIAGEANDITTGRSLLNGNRNANLEQFGAITWYNTETKKVEAWTAANASKLVEAWPDGTPKGWSHKALAPTEPMALYATDKALAERNLEPVRHGLMLSLDEEKLIQYVKSKFDTVIIVWDSITQFELWDLEHDDGISAIVHAGRGTNTGVNNPAAFAARGVARVLSGKVNPSSHLVSQWDRDMTADPTWQNFGDNFHNDSTELYRYSDGTPTGLHGRNSVGGGNGLHGIDYEEGIYLGYKYYETYWYELAKSSTQAAADKWHEENVTYPFGYGLSYTTFDYEIMGVYKGKNRAGSITEDSTVNGSEFASDVGSPAQVDKLYVEVKVTNTGDVAGKAVVQLYATAPYIDGGVEKPFVQSLEFEKTRVLAPTRSQTMIIPFNVQDMASFDYDNRSGLTTGGYILDEGDYTIRAMNSSSVLRSTAKDEFTFEIANGGDAVALRLDDFSGNLVTPVFSTPGTREYSIRSGAMMADATNSMTILSRDSAKNGLGGTFPEAPTYKDLTLNDLYIDDYVRSEVSYLAGYSRARTELGLTTAATVYTTPTAVNGTWTAASSAGNAWFVDTGAVTADGKRADYMYLDDASDPWFIDKTEFDSLTADWTQASQEYRDANPWADTMLREMSGINLFETDGTVNPLWEEFMNGLTYLELQMLASEGNTSLNRIDAIDKNRTSANDNTSYINGMYHWGDQPQLARTYNKDFMAEHGKLTACYAAFGETVTGAETTSPTGWWSPGSNLHRSPFSGRNGDYYGQDARFAGIALASVSASAESYGLAVWIKHPTLNDQETNRNGNGLFTWVDEQTMRENYFPNTQMSYQEGQAQGNMQSFARIGGVMYAYSYAVNIEVYRNQWGWTGISCTDMLRGQGSHAYTVPAKAANWWDAAVGIAGASRDKDRALDTTKHWEQGRSVTLDQLIRGAHGLPDANNANGGSVHNYDATGTKVVSITNYINSAQKADGSANPGAPTAVTDTKTPHATTLLANANDNPASGYWAPKMRNGKGGVYLEYEKNANDPAVMNVSTADMTDTGRNQWYGVRMTAMYACYEAANSNGNRNGMLTENSKNTLRFYHNASQTIGNLTQGTRVTTIDASLETVTNNRQSLYGNSVVYSVVGGQLPAGLTLNPDTGLISGIPTMGTSAETSVTIECRVANYLYGNYTIKFAPIASVLGVGDAVTTVKVGEAVTGQFTGGSGNWSAVGLPDGVTLSTAGVLGGKATVAGTYDIMLTRGSMSMIHTITVVGITEADVQAMIDEATSGLLNQTQVNALITAALDGRITAAEVAALKAAAESALTTAQVQTLIDKAVSGALTEADVQKLIDESLEKNSGCGSTVTLYGGIFGLVILALGATLILVRKGKAKKD